MKTLMMTLCLLAFGLANTQAQNGPQHGKKAVAGPGKCETKENCEGGACKGGKSAKAEGKACEKCKGEEKAKGKDCEKCKGEEKAKGKACEKCKGEEKAKGKACEKCKGEEKAKAKR